MNKDNLSSIMLRIGIALVFLYFGFSQIMSPDSWADLIPEFLTSTIITANNFVMINGILEITLGIFLILGLYTRISALLLSLHLFGIAYTFGLSPTGMRDFGLAVATLVIFIKGNEKYTLDEKFKKERKKISKQKLEEEKNTSEEENKENSKKKKK
jgi:uncharacterized membrane protein YphA (DoxX/SURF4 family)